MKDENTYDASRVFDGFKLILEQRKVLADFCRHLTALSAASIFGVVALLSKVDNSFNAKAFAAATLLFIVATSVGFLMSMLFCLNDLLEKPSQRESVWFSRLLGALAAAYLCGLFAVASVAFRNVLY